MNTHRTPCGHGADIGAARPPAMRGQMAGSRPDLAGRAGRSHIPVIRVAVTGPGWHSRLDEKGLRMTKISLGAHPYLLGFDQLERLAERAAKGADGYPPYNIEHHAPDGFRITLAVAGFSEDDLAITTEDRQLVIRGRMAEMAEDRVFLHRGIAARAFQRSFVLADGVEVVSALLENGLLHVDLKRVAPAQVVQTIPIGRK